MKSVYIESSVISYITARPSRDVVTSARQAISMEWWDFYKDSLEIFVSELVLEEIGSGDSQAASNRLAIIEDSRVGWANGFIVCPRGTKPNPHNVGQQKNDVHPTIGIERHSDLSGNGEAVAQPTKLKSKRKHMTTVSHYVD